MRRSACLLSLIFVACALPEDGNPTPRCALDSHCPAAMRCYRSYCIEEDEVTEVPSSSDAADAGFTRADAATGRDAGVTITADAGAADAGAPATGSTSARVEPPTPPAPPAPPAGPGEMPGPPGHKDKPKPPKPGGPGAPPGPADGPGKGPPPPPPR